MNQELFRDTSDLDSIDTSVRFTHPYCDDMYEHQFPSNFNLSFLASHIDDLYDFIPNEKRIKNSMNEDEASSPASIERGSFVYLDQTDGAIRTTDITAGSHDSVALDFSEYRKKGGLELMDIHTHPDDVLFSAQDYTSLCGSKYGQRYMKAALVLCPTIQMLAFATKNTPKLSLNQSYEYAAAWKETFNQRLQDVYVEEVKLREYLSKNGWNEYSLHASRTNDYESKSKNVANQTLVELSRAINIKMYISTNGQNFQVAN